MKFPDIHNLVNREKNSTGLSVILIITSLVDLILVDLAGSSLYTVSDYMYTAGASYV